VKKLEKIPFEVVVEDIATLTSQFEICELRKSRGLEEASFKTYS
jgi:hypothetical protein